VSEVTLPDRRLFSGFVRDITERKKAEEAAERKTRRLQLLAEGAGSLLTASSPETVVKEIFRGLAPELGLDVYLNFRSVNNETGLVLDSYTGLTEEQASQLDRLEI
ncbi:MAG: hypothetical protein ACK4UN_08770, partial [Limisphaerales bacterium]